MSSVARPRQPRLGADVRREQALDAALAIIVRDGYVAVNMEAVAREMDVAKPVVYSAWGDLQSLLVALLDREETRAFTQLAEALPAPADAAPGSALEAWTGQLAKTVHAHPDTWRLMLLPADGTPAQVRERVDEGRRVVLAQLRAMFGPLLPEGVDADLATHAVLAVTEHLGRLMLADPEAYPPERLVAFASGAMRSLGVRA
jgi:AcrR family transcriptional regulator